MIDVDKVQIVKSIVFGERQSGRTTRCIRYAAKNKATIVCPTMKDVDRITITAEHLGCQLLFSNSLIHGDQIINLNLSLLMIWIEFLISWHGDIQLLLRLKLD